MWLRSSFWFAFVRLLLIGQHLIKIRLGDAQHFPQRALEDFRVRQFSLWVSHLHGLYYTCRAWIRRPAAVGLRITPRDNPEPMEHLQRYEPSTSGTLALDDLPACETGSNAFGELSITPNNSPFGLAKSIIASVSLANGIVCEKWSEKFNIN
jgi:hypothetical protein